MSTIKDSEAVHLLDESQLAQGNIENANEPESSKEAFITDMQKELGVPNNVSKPPMRKPLMKYHSGRLFANLYLVADYNVREQEYDPPEPRLNLSMGDKRVWLPTDSETVRLLAEFLSSVAEVLSVADFPHKEYDIEEIKRMLSSCGCVVEDVH